MTIKLSLGVLAFAAAIAGCQSGEDRGAAAEAAAAPLVAQGAEPAAGAQQAPSTAQPVERSPDVVFVPTPEPVVKAMLRMAGVGPNDVVYDLGCGDGRIAVAAARDFGARSVCIDIDPRRIKEARASAKAAGVEDRVEIRQGDLFEADISDATVVTLYLLERLNVKLKPKLLKELRPGTRVVSQTFRMGDWQPHAEQEVNGTSIYMWTIPAGGKTTPAGEQ